MDTKKEENLSRWQKFLETCKTLSVEPAGFLLMISLVVAHLIFQNLLMEMICVVDLQYDKTTCTEIISKVNATYKAQEIEIQKVAAGIQAITSVVNCSATVLVVLFIGQWSDANGRKMPLLLSVTGLVCFSLSLIAAYLSMGTISALWFTLLAMAPVAVTGGGVVFTMSCYSYIADTTNSKSRTVRTGLLSAAIRSGTPIGFALGGALTRGGVGPVISLLVSLVLSSIALVIVVLTVKNIKPIQIQSEEEGQDEIEGEQKAIGNGNADGKIKVVEKKESSCAKYNPITKLYQVFAILFKKRKNRIYFYLLIVCSICYSAPGSGEMSMLYLFVRAKLGWTLGDFGYFSMYNWLLSAVGVVLSMFFLSKTLKISDPVVGFVAGLSQIGGSTMYAFAYSAVTMYLASAMDMMNGTIGVICRSMLSKTVRHDEVGKLFALLGVIESLLPLVMVPTYAMVYRSTISIFPGTFFFLSAAAQIPAEIIFMIFICKKKDPTPDPKELQPLDERNEEEEKEIAQLVTLMPKQMYLSSENVLKSTEAINTNDNDNDEEKEDQTTKY